MVRAAACSHQHEHARETAPHQRATTRVQPRACNHQRAITSADSAAWVRPFLKPCGRTRRIALELLSRPAVPIARCQGGFAGRGAPPPRGSEGRRAPHRGQRDTADSADSAARVRPFPNPGVRPPVRTARHGGQRGQCCAGASIPSTMCADTAASAGNFFRARPSLARGGREIRGAGISPARGSGGRAAPSTDSAG